MELQQRGQAAPRIVYSKGCSSKQELHRTSKALTGKKAGQQRRKEQHCKQKSRAWHLRHTIKTLKAMDKKDPSL